MFCLCALARQELLCGLCEGLAGRGRWLCWCQLCLGKSSLSFEPWFLPMGPGSTSLVGLLVGLSLCL